MADGWKVEEYDGEWDVHGPGYRSSGFPNEDDAIDWVRRRVPRGTEVKVVEADGYTRRRKT